MKCGRFSVSRQTFVSAKSLLLDMSGFEASTSLFSFINVDGEYSSLVLNQGLALQ